MNAPRNVANCGFVQFTKREMTNAKGPRIPKIDHPLTRTLTIVAAIGAFLAFTNPFGATGSLPYWASFLYWTTLVGEGWFGATFIARALEITVPRIGALANRIAATVLIAAVVSGTVVLFQIAIDQPVSVSYYPRLYGLVLGVSIAIAGLAWLVDRAFKDQWPGAQTHAAPAGARPVRFMERLPPKLRGAALHAVSSEDHYLRLHTSKGSDLILMRLSDAITELEGLEGAQTHRSWWVARDGVESTRRDGDKLVLILKGGAEAPVSRPNVRVLREAGWY